MSSRDRPSLSHWLSSLLNGVQSMPRREARFAGDPEALDKPLTNEDEKRGYERAIEEMRKALFGDRNDLLEAAAKLYGFTPGYFPKGAVPQYGESTTQDPNGDYDPRAWENCPLFSEHYLYELFGKEDARTILALLSNMLETVGVVHWRDLGAARQKQEEEKKEQHERERDRLARQRGRPKA